MIVLVRADADADAVGELVKSVREMGLEVVPLDERKGHGFEVVGSDRGRVLDLRDAPAVDVILTRRTGLTGGEPLWPHFVLRLSILCLLLLVALVLLSAFLPTGLSDRLPKGAQQAEWFLRPLAGFLSLFPPNLRGVGGTLILLYWVSFILWPFLDRADPRTPRGRRVARFVFAMGVAFLVFLLVLGIRSAA